MHILLSTGPISKLDHVKTSFFGYLAKYDERQINYVAL